jgi:Zn-dependent protease
MFVLQFAILIYSVILHEVAHGWLADYLGDPTARLAKRLTLDPRPHIDPLMTIGLPLLLIISGSPVVFGAAKPVPIDPFNFRDPQKDIALTAAAGPVTNILIALVFAILLRLAAIFILNADVFNFIQGLCLYTVEINVFLAVFNLLPIPPLDGFKVVGGLLPKEYAPVWYSFERFGLMLIILVLFLFSPLINGVILPVSRTILRVLLP